MSLSPEEQAEVSYAYWHSERTVAEIARAYEIPEKDVWILATPEPAGVECPYDEVRMVWQSRQARLQREPTCPSCGHRPTGRCKCPGCRAEKEKRREEREAAEAAAPDAFASRFADEDDLRQVLRQLSGPQRQYLIRLVSVFNGGPPRFTWEAIAESAGLSPRYAPAWRDRLVNLGLVRQTKAGWEYNPALAEVDLLLP